MTAPPQHAELKIAYYGDDFTGSTDAMECLATAGLRTLLFLDPPTPMQLAALPDVEAIGVAGRSRALPTHELEAEVRPIFTALRALKPRHVHYKVCSTFDSSPEIGSIGRVIDIGAEVFDSSVVPLMVGTPSLGRWCVFGNLFAEVGIGSGGEVFRLDRHPAMRRHPSTPADESDLRVHLARQTDKFIGLFDVRQLDGPADEVAQAFRGFVDSKPAIVLFDIVSDRQYATIGRLIDSCVRDDASCFSVGSSGIEMALTSYWGRRTPRSLSAIQTEGASEAPVIVASGSRSPVTSDQIEFALAHGFVEAPIDVQRTVCEESSTREIERVIAIAIASLGKGRSVIVHSNGTPRSNSAELSAPQKRVVARKLGCALGEVLARCVGQWGVQRACIAGGDTSSYAAREMGITSLEMIATGARGSPLCRIRASQPTLDGVEMAFKGGQVGRPDFFVTFAQKAPVSENQRVD